MQPKLNFVVKALIIAGMILGLALLIYVTRYLFIYAGMPAVNGKPGWQFVASYALGVVCFALAEYIAWTLLTMMKSLDENPFVMKNVRALRRMGFAALAITVCGLATILMQSLPLVVVFALPIGMCGLFSLVLSNVFARAVAFKEENDLTV